jgi:CBS domain-containing protein
MMKVRDVMTPNVEVIEPDAPVQAAARKMKSLDVGSLPVCDGRRLVGMITDRDVAVRAVAEGLDPQQTAIRDIMTPKILYCFDDDDLERAAVIMHDQQIRRLPVINREKKLVGIIALGDLAVDMTDQELIGEVLEGISHPSEPSR